MARPRKKGLDFFPLDCFMDDSVKLIQAEFGLDGFAVVVKLFQKIYGENGYYLEFDRERLLLFTSQDCGLSSGSENKISEIVAACIRRNIFSETMYKRYGILTSAGIQRRYLTATARRSDIRLKKEYLLISVDKTAVNVDNNSINAGENSVNAGDNPKSKRKESKRNSNNIYASETLKIVAYLNAQVGCNYLPTTDYIKRLIHARLRETFTVDDFKKVIDKKTAEWKGTEMEMYLRPQTLFSNKFESYLNQPERTGAKKAGEKNGFHNFDQRNYDYEDLEKQLLNNQ